MSPREHLERNADIRPDDDNGGIVQEVYRPPVASWFQKRLVYVRKELKKEIQTKVIHLTKGQ